MVLLVRRTHQSHTPFGLASPCAAASDLLSVQIPDALDDKLVSNLIKRFLKVLDRRVRV